MSALAEEEYLRGLGELQRWREEEMRGEELTDDQQLFLKQPSTLHRYLTAHNGDVAAAKAGILATLEWRKEHLARPFRCESCISDAKSHCFFPLGLTDRIFDRPAHVAHPHVIDDASHVKKPGLAGAGEACGARMMVVYASQPRAGHPGVEEQVNHVIATLEHMFTFEPAIHYQWVWVVDFNGWSWSHAMQARVGIATLNVFTRHQPERLGNIIFINSPRIFSAFLSAVRPFADARTMAKVHSLRGEGRAVGEELVGRYGLSARTAAWIVEAMGMRALPGELPPLPDEAKPYQLHSLPS